MSWLLIYVVAGALLNLLVWFVLGRGPVPVPLVLVCTLLWPACVIAGVLIAWVNGANPFDKGEL